MIWLNQQGADVLLPVKVVPNASRDRIVGELDGRLKVTVASPPERGAANQAVCQLIARGLKLRKQQVAIEEGQTSAQKLVRVKNMTIAAVARILPRHD